MEKTLVYVPTTNGIGDQLIGLVTAGWLARKTNRSLSVCLDYEWVHVPRSSACERYRRLLSAKNHTNFVERVNGTVLLGCNNRCRELRPAVGYISKDLSRRYWNNPAFLRTLENATDVVVQTNRNAVAFVAKLETRRILQSMIRPSPPRYENCLHHRSLRTRLSLDALVRCASRDPMVVFSDLTSAHLYRVDRPKRAQRKVVRLPANDTASFLELTRCKKYWIPSSSFSVAAALVSTASYDDITVYDNRNCSKTVPLLRAHTLFFPR